MDRQTGKSTAPAAPGILIGANIMAKENFQPGMKVVVWGKYDPVEAPQILSVRKNGIWITRSERDLLGRIKITKQRVPLHAVSPV